MNKKTIITASVVFLFAAGGAFVLTKRVEEAQRTKDFLDEYQALVDKENEGNATTTHTNSGGSETHGSNKEQGIVVVLDLTNQSEVVMNIKDFKYEKPAIKIKKGTTVTWINQDVIKHNVMLEHEDGDKAHAAPTSKEVDPKKLAGPLLEKGESYSFTFTEVVAHPYHCSPHPTMKGTIIVVE